MRENMKKVVITEYCDRCKMELPRSKIYHDIFSFDHLNIKFDRIRFSALPFRWAKDSKISTRYITKKDELFVLCPTCAKEFCEWWELKGEEK